MHWMLRSIVRRCVQSRIAQTCVSQNGIAERSIRRACLDHIIVLSGADLGRAPRTCGIAASINRLAFRRITAKALASLKHESKKYDAISRNLRETASVFQSNETALAVYQAGQTDNAVQSPSVKFAAVSDPAALSSASSETSKLRISSSF